MDKLIWASQEVLKAWLIELILGQEWVATPERSASAKLPRGGVKGRWIGNSYLVGALFPTTFLKIPEKTDRKALPVLSWLLGVQRGSIGIQVVDKVGKSLSFV